MTQDSTPITIRPFTPGDAGACFEMRRDAFTRVFCKELEREEVASGANAYTLEEFEQILGILHSFLAVDGEEQVGFCTIRLLDSDTAEIVFLYVRLDRLTQGIGNQLATHAERWLAQQYPSVSMIVLDTAVPVYNRKFYEKLGYSVIGESVCRYPDRDVRAIRLAKRLRHSPP
jgi:ribosomal protein S18 acetylase RimI-like enzyme